MLDQTAETGAGVYATQVVTLHGACSKLTTDHCAAFMPSFFNETCKILGIQRARTSPYHPAFNGQLECWHRSLHDALSHFKNAANTNWDVFIAFELHRILRLATVHSFDVSTSNISLV